MQLTMLKLSNGLPRGFAVPAAALGSALAWAIFHWSRRARKSNQHSRDPTSWNRYRYCGHDNEARNNEYNCSHSEQCFSLNLCHNSRRELDNDSHNSTLDRGTTSMTKKKGNLTSLKYLTIVLGMLLILVNLSILE